MSKMGSSKNGKDRKGGKQDTLFEDYNDGKPIALWENDGKPSALWENDTIEAVYTEAKQRIFQKSQNACNQYKVCKSC